MGGRAFGVIAIGQFTGEKKRYGHMNEFDFLFNVKCYEKAQMLDREGSVPQGLTSEEVRKVEEFENAN